MAVNRTGDEVLDTEGVVPFGIRSIGNQVLIVADGALFVLQILLVLILHRELRLGKGRRDQQERGRQGHQGFIDLFHCFRFSLNRCFTAGCLYCTV